MNSISFSLLLFTLTLGCDCVAQDPGIPIQSVKNQRDTLDIPPALSMAIRESNALYGEAFIKCDSLLFVDRYDMNAWIMPPNSIALEGPTAAPAFFSVAYRQMKIRNVILTTKELYPHGEFATEVGNFELLDVHANVVNRGKYIVVWKSIGGKWKMYRDCFNSDLK